MNGPAHNSAEEVDETVTTTDGDASTIRATYPPERPMGVEDPSVAEGGSETRDDLVTREWREEPDVPPPHRPPPDVPETEIVPRPKTDVIPDPEPDPPEPIAPDPTKPSTPEVPPPPS